MLLIYPPRSDANTPQQELSSKFKIPKGTLYDNILGKTKRSRMLEEVGLSSQQEMAVLEFACDVVMMPYNRRTSR